MTWTRGLSGNRTGRPKGAKNRYGAELLEAHSRRLLRALIEKAQSGDLQALAICADRLWPKLKPVSPPVSVSITAHPTDLAGQGRELLEAAFTGVLSPDIAETLVGALNHQARLVEVTEIENRLTALEGKLPHRSPTPQRRRINLENDYD